MRCCGAAPRPASEGSGSAQRSKAPRPPIWRRPEWKKPIADQVRMDRRSLLLPSESYRPERPELLVPRSQADPLPWTAEPRVRSFARAWLSGVHFEKAFAHELASGSSRAELPRPGPRLRVRRMATPRATRAASPSRAGGSTAPARAALGTPRRVSRRGALNHDSGRMGLVDGLVPLWFAAAQRAHIGEHGAAPGHDGDDVRDEDARYGP